MGYEPFLITPFEKSGLSKYYKPYLIGNEAFPDIEDAYPWRGTVRKREGFRLLATFPGGDKPVQGLKNWVNPATLGNSLIGFSKTKSYLYNDATLIFNDITHLSTGATAFSFGNGDDDYFWSCNYAGSMWVANGLGLTTAGVPAAVNGILYLTANADNSWNIHQPELSGSPATNFLNGCLIILPYKGRLVVLNTIEGPANGVGNQAFTNRARWSQIGTPYNTTGGGVLTNPPQPFGIPANNFSWHDDIPGRGGFIDADTSEQIVSAEIVKDTLIVFFQRSTWRLRYTGNEILPFIWERLNTQYGAESTYSNVAFDDAALAFSRFGWIAANTNDVARIDEDIPDDSFAIESINKTTMVGLKRVQGIRDFYRQFAYWTYESDTNLSVNEIYAYNYIDKTWSVFNPSVTIRTFGYYRTLADQTWATLNTALDTWNRYNSVNDTWNSFAAGNNINFPYIVGGDPDGNVYQMFEFFGAPTTDNGTNYGFAIETKRFNPYFAEGVKCRMGYVDLYFTDMPGGEITFNYYIDDYDPAYADPFLTREVPLSVRGQIAISSITLGATTTINTVTPHLLVNNQITNMSGILGTAGLLLNNLDLVATVVSTTQFTVPIDTITSTYVANTGVVFSSQLSVGQAKYTRLFFNVTANFHQFVMNLSLPQLNDPVKGAAQFQLQALVLWAKRGARIKG